MWVGEHSFEKTPNNPIKHIISFSTQELNQLSESSQVRESEKRKKSGQRKGEKRLFCVLFSCCSEQNPNKALEKEPLDLGKHGGASRASLCNCPAWLAISSLVQDQSVAEMP